MENIYEFEEIGMYYQLGIYEDEEDEGKQKLKNQITSVIYSILQYGFGDIIDQNEDNYYEEPIIVAHSAGELEKYIRETILNHLIL